MIPYALKERCLHTLLRMRLWCNIITQVGTEELAHMEIVAAIIHQLTRNLSMEEIEKCGFAPYYVDHTVGIWPQSAGGFPFSASQFQVTGDPITDLTEDLAAEQKARTTYDNILRLIKEPDVCEPIKFLRMREVVHFQRFGDANREDYSRTHKIQSLRSIPTRPSELWTSAFVHKERTSRYGVIRGGMAAYIVSFLILDIFSLIEF